MPSQLKGTRPTYLGSIQIEEVAKDNNGTG